LATFSSYVLALAKNSYKKCAQKNVDEIAGWYHSNSVEVICTLRCGVMGGFSQMSAISELFRRTKRFRTICFTKGSKRMKPRLRTADKMAQKVKPEKEIKII